MNHQLITTRASLTIAGAVMLGVALAGPSVARPDAGSGDVGTPVPGLPYSQDAYENHYLSPLPEPAPPVAPPTTYRFIDDGSLEYLQLGAGLLAGVALAGAGIVTAPRRTDAHAPRPA